jgi:hypothetical protein
LVDLYPIAAPRSAPQYLPSSEACRLVSARWIVTASISALHFSFLKPAQRDAVT